MTDEEIVNLFYNEFLEECTTNGRVDCYRIYNLPLSTLIEDKINMFLSYDKYNDIHVPTLCINNKESFNPLLITYLRKAIEFYDNRNYFDLVRDSEKLKIKTLMCSLFANATWMDFNNPYRFLENRIKMLDSRLLDSDEEVCLGYSDILNGNVILREKKASINDETPYEIVGRIESLDGNIFYIPTIRLSKINGELYIYAIQSKDRIDKEDEYSKSIYDILKHVDKGFTLSFIIPALLGMGLSRARIVHIIPCLICRWNAKHMALNYLVVHNNLSKEAEEKLYDEQYLIQENLTDKFLRIFERIVKHANGVEVAFFDFYDDRRFSLSVDYPIDSNRPIMDELYDMGYKYEKDNNKKLT